MFAEFFALLAQLIEAAARWLEIEISDIAEVEIIIQPGEGRHWIVTVGEQDLFISDFLGELEVTMIWRHDDLVVLGDPLQALFTYDQVVVVPVISRYPVVVECYQRSDGEPFYIWCDPEKRGDPLALVESEIHASYDWDEVAESLVDGYGVDPAAPVWQRVCQDCHQVESLYEVAGKLLCSECIVPSPEYQAAEQVVMAEVTSQWIGMDRQSGSGEHTRFCDCNICQERSALQAHALLRSEREDV